MSKIKAKETSSGLGEGEERVIEISIPNNQPLATVKIEMVEDEDANYVCPRCCKTFYNLMALRNHLNHVHGLGPEDVDLPEPPSPKLTRTPKRSEVKQSPQLSPEATHQSQEEGRLIQQTISSVSADDAQKLVNLAYQDVSYIIVKTADGEPPLEVKRRPRTGAARSAESTPRRREAIPVQLNGPFECLQRSGRAPGAVCHLVFFNCCEYSLHYRREHTKRRKPGLRCQVCEKQLDGQVLAESAPDEEMARTCVVCRLQCEDSAQLALHAKAAHARPKPWRCNICQKGFTQQGGLIQHMRMHTGDRPFPCTVCGKAFTQKAGLDQHLRIHTKIKPFRCVVCDKSFSQSVHLRQHMRTHTNIQPFQCGACGRRFKQSSHLNFHIKSHQMEAGHAALLEAEDAGEEYMLDSECNVAVETIIGE